MSGNKRTEDFHTIKTRQMTWQNPDGSFPPVNYVLGTEDSRGHVVPIPITNALLPNGACQSDYLSWDVVANTWVPGGSQVHIGCKAGATGQGIYSVAVGFDAGSISQGINSVAVGRLAGSINQKTSSVAIGDQAAYGNQENYAVAVGYLAGGINQQAGAVAIGAAAGGNSQQERAVAIGAAAGGNGQQGGAVAVGAGAGAVNQQAHAIAIGSSAGANEQPANSIILNATGVILDVSGATGGLFAAPLRGVTSGTTGWYYMAYNTTTFEIAYVSDKPI